MLRIFSFIFSCFFQMVLVAQDTIIFSFHPTQPPSYFNQFRLSPNLFSPNNNRIDLFINEQKNKIGVPINYVGSQELPSGCLNYVGIVTYNKLISYNLKEKIEYGIINSQFSDRGFVQIKSPKKILNNKEYLISFKISLADYSKYATSGWGIFFNNEEIKHGQNIGGKYKPQVVFSGVIKEKQQWVELSGKYKTNNEDLNFITVGCFDENYKIEEVVGGYGFGNSKAYYYLTDFKMIEIPLDSDKDGVIDLKDLCPTIFGLVEFSGCPDIDNDKIPDRIDLCPTIKGTVQFDGCPDTDNDGVDDRKDKCPTVFGKINNDGCPVEIIDTCVEKKNIQTILKTIQLENDNMEISNVSKNTLDKLILFLKSSPTLLHMDELFKDDLNDKQTKALIEKKINLIIHYLVDKGYDAKNIKYHEKDVLKNDSIKLIEERRIEIEVSNPK